MPGKSTKKELYLGKCLSDLNKYSEVKDLGNNVSVIIKSADKMFKEAERLDRMEDEERAYVLYMKYFNVIQQTKKKADYKKQKDYFDSLIGKNSSIKAIERAEKLASSLKNRYDEIEANLVAEKLAKLHKDKKSDNIIEDSSEIKKKDEADLSSVNEEKENQNETDKLSGSIMPLDLYKLLQDKNVKIIIMDVRPSSDFSASHIKHPACISVPEEILKPGTTVKHIANCLPSESLSLWSERDRADYIILFDWDSREETSTVGTPLKTLKDALYQYDSTVTLKHEPVILEDGYEQWLLYYPTLSTNPRVTKPQDDQSASTQSGLDFSYPDFDEPKSVPPQNKSGQSETSIEQSPSNHIVPNKNTSLPSVDRSLKPKGGSSGSSITLNNSIETVTKQKPSSNPDLKQSTNESLFDRIRNTLYPSVVKNVSAGSHTADVVDLKTRSSTSSSSLSMMTDSSSGSSTSSVSSIPSYRQIQTELEELGKIQSMKQQELALFQKEKEKMLLEHKARMLRLVQEQEKIDRLGTIRRKEEKDVADLMRMKRSLQEEMKKEEHQQREKVREEEEEEGHRLRELERIRELELEKKRRQEEVEKLRIERKMKEKESKKAEMKKEAKEKEIREKVLSEIAERTRQEELELENRKAINAQEEEEEEERRKVAEENERMKKEEERKKEEQRRKEEEKRRKEEELRSQEEARRLKEQKEKEKKEEEERMKKEKERKEKENIARLIREADELKKEDERRKVEEELKAQEALKIAEEKIRRIAEQHPQSKIVPSTNMPTGWEKRLDRATNRYFYINHNNGTTQWEPPVLPNTPTARASTYTTKIKEEPTSSSFGLKRSFSSPDIMKLMNEQELSPRVNRSAKPAERPQQEIRAAPVQRIVKRRDLNPIYGNVGSALTGLRNLGNTCYMNSTIQCLNNTSPLVTYFLSDNYVYDINRDSFQGMHGEVVDEFAVVVKALWSRQYRCITPRDLKLTVGKYNPMFAGYEQHDSQEFLTFLLDGLHEGLNEVKKRPHIPDQDNENYPDHQAAEMAWKNYKLLHKSIIVELFQGQLKSTLQCKSCGKQSKTFQTFMFLSVPIPSSYKCSLHDCIVEFLKPERLTGDCRWRCPRCRIDRESTKKIDIWKLPPILLIGLNRFVRDGMWVQKKTSYVDFPVTDLDLHEWVQGVKPKTKYNLYAVSNHYGTMEGGHYTAFCRNPESQRWYKFDDHEVYEMSSSDVKSPAAYFLYYTSIEMQAPSYSARL